MRFEQLIAAEFRRIERTRGRWLMGSILALVPLAWIYDRSRFRHPAFDVAGAILVVVAIVAATASTVRGKLKVAEDFGLRCPDCRRLPRMTRILHTALCERCLRCGRLLEPKHPQTAALTNRAGGPLTMIRRLLVNPSESARDELLGDDSIVFWVDSREDDSAIAESCEEVLRSGKLSAAWEGKDLIVSFGDRRRQVTLVGSPADRHITLLTLNQVLAPDFEIRLVWDSDGAFTALPANDWKSIEEELGAERVSEAFMRLAERPNVFTDRIKRPGRRPWWKN